MSENKSRKRFLCVGLVCLDCITVCDGYPEEDSDQRCIDILWQRGGNASNTSTTLTLLGENCEFFGVVADGLEQRIIEEDFTRHGIINEHCVRYTSIRTPIATILSNTRNASRTILSCQRNLPELTLEDFNMLPLNSTIYKWIHFEGRPNVDVITAMLGHVDKLNEEQNGDKIMTSVEIEKRRDNLRHLFDKADVVFVSKDYARWRGYQNMSDAVKGMFSECRPGSILICPWGEDGAAAMSHEQGIVTSPAYRPIKLVDTLAAGDTFIGATISCLCQGHSLKQALTFGCRVAGEKCGMRGWDNMKERVREIEQ